MDIARILSGGDRRSIGRSGDVVAHVLKHPTALPGLMAALSHKVAVVRMRAADALEKISAQQPAWLDPFSGELLAIAAATEEQEIRWHTAQILPRLSLDTAERESAIALMSGLLDDKSRIVQVSALTALVDFAIKDAGLRRRVIPLVNRAAMSEAPSLRARAKALAKRLGISNVK